MNCEAKQLSYLRLSRRPETHSGGERVAMADMMQAGQQWLAGQITQFASRPVIYRSGDEYFWVLAAIGKTIGEQDAGDGLILQAEIRDYLIDASGLYLAAPVWSDLTTWTDVDFWEIRSLGSGQGVRILPKRGDQIIELVDGMKFIYEVLPIGSQKPWRYSDPYRLKLRIHTKLTGTEEIE